MIAIKQHQPTWYQLSYNPDLMTGKQETSTAVQESWEKGEGQYLFAYSINFQVTITFLAIWLVDAARLSRDSYWLASF